MASKHKRALRLRLNLVIEPDATILRWMARMGKRHRSKGVREALMKALTGKGGYPYKDDRDVSFELYLNPKNGPDKAIVEWLYSIPKGTRADRVKAILFQEARPEVPTAQDNPAEAKAGKVAKDLFRSILKTQEQS